MNKRLLLCLLAAASMAVACSDSKNAGPRPEPGDTDAGVDAGIGSDAGTSRLPRPALERPPVDGLPADLRPPR
jgi:hypothetical protein